MFDQDHKSKSNIEFSMINQQSSIPRIYNHKHSMNEQTDDNHLFHLLQQKQRVDHLGNKFSIY